VDRNLDELMAEMERDELEDADFLTPREFAKTLNMQPQLVYYYIRRGVIKDERCICGRRVVNVRAATEALQAQARTRRGDVDTRADHDREAGEGAEGQGSAVSGVQASGPLEGPDS
jgi:hypothetical protein